MHRSFTPFLLQGILAVSLVFGLTPHLSSAHSPDVHSSDAADGGWVHEGMADEGKITGGFRVGPSFTTQDSGLSTVGPVITVAAGVSVWQFIIGNFVQPRMTSESLNLSAVVVLLALAIWGLMWGIVGAFLAAPMTVMIMIVLAQFPSTRWIAILLSADGKPLADDTVAKAKVSNSDSDSN